jgi:HK97 family phage portal protein
MPIASLYRNWALDNSRPRDFIRGITTAMPTASGESVTPQSALDIDGVFAAIRYIAEDVAKLPLAIYERLPSGGRRMARDHPSYSLVHDRPNPLMTSGQLRETLIAQALAFGSAYAEIVRDNGGKPVALWPTPPQRMRLVEDDVPRMEFHYEFQADDGAWQRLEIENVIEIRGLSMDGIVANLPLEHGREALGLSKAAQKHAAKFFGDGASVYGAIQLAHDSTQEQYDTLRQRMEQVGGSRPITFSLLPQSRCSCSKRDGSRLKLFAG